MNADRPHLLPALAAFLVLLIGLVAAHFYALHLENRYVYAMAAQMNLESMNGSILQRIAIQKPDMLLVYGSSEMINMDTPNRSVSFFKDFPTGFNVYEVAMGGVTCLNMAQDLAALGPDLHNNKVVISFTPVMFNSEMVHPNAYWGSYSRLHANETVFSLNLSMGLKRDLARRMLDYPDTIKDDALLTFALEQLKANTPLNDFLYDLSMPLGQLNLQVIHIQDHNEVLSFIRAHPDLSYQVGRHEKTIDWKNEISKALVEQQANANNNPYGVDNDTWSQDYHDFKAQPAGAKDTDYVKNLNTSKEWGDLDLVFRILKEMGAKPLIMSRPINGPFYIANGISPEAQNIYYNKLEKAVTPYNFQLEDFQSFTMDKYFNTDFVSHTSRTGWIYVNQVFDKFFHQFIP